MRFNHAPEVMPDRHNSRPIVPNDVMILIQRVALAIAHGLDLNDTVSVEALARQLETIWCRVSFRTAVTLCGELQEKFGYKPQHLFTAVSDTLSGRTGGHRISWAGICWPIKKPARALCLGMAQTFKTAPPCQRGRPRKSPDQVST